MEGRYLTERRGVGVQPTNEAVDELLALESEFWAAFGSDLLDGLIGTKEYRTELIKFGVECYKLGVLSAAEIIERRMDGRKTI